ncbi:MAG: hypothetical protein R3282_04280 [Rhodothermales bacterium]|nr:hypothetical protein [Rhodothermales bacterium]
MRKPVFGRRGVVCALVVGAALASGCSFNDSRPDPPGTRVTGVSVEPNPVRKGDDTVITVSHTRMNEGEFTYAWNRIGITYTNSVTWTADEEPGTYKFSMVIYRSGNFDPVGHGFEVTVVDE